MNTSAKMNQILKLAFALAVALSTVACGSANNDERLARASNGVTPFGQNTTRAGACASPAGAVGRVFDDAALAQYGSFEARVKALISANYNPEYIGSVVGVNAASPTCVTLEGSLQFGSNGQIIADKASLRMKVYDSLADTPDTTGQPAGAYPIEFATAQSGQIESDGKFTVVFGDALGTLTITGRIVQSQVQGEIAFVNIKSFNGGSGASGPLGSFAINAASFIRK